jgi:formylglycine-generating enzyme required for sulfatase activity
MIAVIAAVVVLIVVGFLLISWRLRFETITNSIGMKLTLIPAGEFWMGSPDDDKDARNHEKPRHKVVITKPFYIGVYEVTRGEIFDVFGKNPNGVSSGPKDLPAEKITWDEASDFCRKLTELERNYARLPAGWEYRLPTEAEWEYACRAGSQGRYSFGDNPSSIASYAWCISNSGKQTHQVGRKRANAFGLYDMYGNVSEWCLDMFGKYPAETVYDPTGEATGPGRVRRGGNSGADASGMRSAERFFGTPSHRYIGQGFRVVRVKIDSEQAAK